VPVPLPAADEVRLGPPDAAETRHVVGGVAAAIAPEGGLTPLQRVMIEALAESMTGFVVPASAVPRVGPEAFARGLARRDEAFRTRMLQYMLLGELVLVPLPAEVADRIERYARELCISDSIVKIARRYANGSLGLALIDFQRSGYMETWDPASTEHLHTSRALDEAWEQRCDDPELAARWAALAECPEGSLGRAVSRFYAARNFSFPGLPQSAPPLLAQHDWVHVLAEYGSTVESEIEVFAFIARANDDPRGFSLLAMVISLFETGYMSSGAGLFSYDRGHLSHEGMPARLADAMRRGALVGAAAGGPDLLRIDWFTHAERPVDEVRAEFGIVAKSERALASGSVGPWEPGGISPFQYESGRAAAAAAGREYDSYGAVPEAHSEPVGGEQ
jgi:hypothetical protein